MSDEFLGRGLRLAHQYLHLIRKVSRTAVCSKRLAVFILLSVLLIFMASCQFVPTSVAIPSTLPSSEEPTDPAETLEPTSTQQFTDITSPTVEPSITQTSETIISETSVGETSTEVTETSASTQPAAPTPTVRPNLTSTPAPTRKPTATPTVRPTLTPTPTLKPTSTPTPSPSPTTAAAPSFPFINFGAFFRNEYGTNGNIIVSSDGGVEIDIGSAPQGVALVKVSESSIPSDKSCKVVASANGKTYQYEIMSRGTFLGIPLQMGDGSYTINVYGQISGTSYYSAMAHTFNVELASSLKPFTASSIMVNFSTGSACVSKANTLCSGLTTTDSKVLAVYNWIAANISYDTELASAITSGQVTIYIPDPDKTYDSRKGICFDYASLMCAMLRSQGVPTRLAVGSVQLSNGSTGYHAWNEVYFKGTGWVVVASFNYSYVDGSSWVMFDPTFAAGGLSPETILKRTHTKQKTY